MFLTGPLRKRQTNNILLGEKLVKQSFQELATDFKLLSAIFSHLPRFQYLRSRESEQLKSQVLLYIFLKFL